MTPLGYPALFFMSACDGQWMRRRTCASPQVPRCCLHQRRLPRARGLVLLLLLLPADWVALGQVTGSPVFTPSSVKQEACQRATRLAECPQQCLTLLLLSSGSVFPGCGMAVPASATQGRLRITRSLLLAALCRVPPPLYTQGKLLK